MANEDLKQEIERLKKRQIEMEERQELAKELNKLKAKEWQRQHPRLANLYYFLSNFGFRKDKSFYSQ